MCHDELSMKYINGWKCFWVRLKLKPVCQRWNGQKATNCVCVSELFGWIKIKCQLFIYNFKLLFSFLFAYSIIHSHFARPHTHTRNKERDRERKKMLSLQMLTQIHFADILTDFNLYVLPLLAHFYNWQTDFNEPLVFFSSFFFHSLWMLSGFYFPQFTMILTIYKRVLYIRFVIIARSKQHKAISFGLLFSGHTFHKFTVSMCSFCLSLSRSVGLDFALFLLLFA